MLSVWLGLKKLLVVELDWVVSPPWKFMLFLLLLLIFNEVFSFKNKLTKHEKEENCVIKMNLVPMIAETIIKYSTLCFSIFNRESALEHILYEGCNVVDYFLHTIID